VSLRVTPTEFQGINLRCHAFLADVPLHDVWAIPVEGGGPNRTIHDAYEILFGSQRPRAPLAVRALFTLRWSLGRMFGWDTERHDSQTSSYVHRLSDADRLQSTVRPGTRSGPFRVLYAFANEAVAEIRNATVHGFMALALVPEEAVPEEAGFIRPNAYTLYLAVYVKPVNRLTPFYMALIEPFRRFIVYPALCRGAQRTWSRRYGTVRS
jgi:hypothetical protein